MIDVQQLLDDCTDRQKRWGFIDLEDCTPTERAEFLRTNVLALQVEIIELLDTYRWKPWAVDAGIPREHRDRVLDEAADVFFFLGNVLAGLDLTSDEIDRGLIAKREIIEARHNSDAYAG